MYKELLAYLSIHCGLTGSAASAHATTAELFGKYLLDEHEYTETDSDSSSDSLVVWKHSKSSEGLLPLQHRVHQRKEYLVMVVWFFVQPGHERVSDKLLSELIFLKCNIIYYYYYYYYYYYKRKD